MSPVQDVQGLTNFQAGYLFHSSISSNIVNVAQRYRELKRDQCNLDSNHFNCKRIKANFGLFGSVVVKGDL